MKQNLSGTDENIENTVQRIENIAKQDIKTKLSDSFKYVIQATTTNRYIQIIKNKLKNELH